MSDKPKYIALEGRSVIAVSGEDSYKFLQGLITNDIGKVTDNSSIYAYLLTAQGKFLYDFFISFYEGRYLFDIASENKDEFLKKLKMYKLRSVVEIADISSEYSVYSLIDISLSLKNEGKRISSENGFVHIDPRNRKMSARAILKNDLAHDMLSKYEKTDISEYTKLRIMNNIPEGGYDLEKEKSYPLQYRMIELNGVDFKKGCYVGQEVTARTQHRSGIRKTTYLVEAPFDLSDRMGLDIESNAVSVGKILSAYGINAIALIERDVVEKSPNSLTILGYDLKIIN